MEDKQVQELRTALDGVASALSEGLGAVAVALESIATEIHHQGQSIN